MKKTMLFLVWFFATQAFGQTRDANFEAKRDQVEQLAYSDADAAFSKADAILREAKQSRSAARIAKAESTMALVKIYLTELEDAKKRNDQSLAYHLKNEDAGELANNYFNAALLSERESDYISSVKYFLRTISNAEKSKDYTLIQKSYRGLSMSYLDQQNFDKALEFATKSLDYQKFKSDVTQKAYAVAAIAEIYRSKQNLSKANENFKAAFDIFASDKNEQGKAWVLTNWALCYENDLIRFTEMSLEAQKIWDRVAPENTMSIMNLGNIGYNYMLIACNDSLIAAAKSPEMPKTDIMFLNQGEKYMRRCLAVANKKNNRNAIGHHSINLSSLLYVKKDFKGAYDELHKGWRLYDSLYSQENKNKIAALESEKDILMRDEKIKRDKLTLANKEKQKWYLIGGLVLLGVIGLLLFNQSRNRRKTNDKLQSLNADLDNKNASLDKANKTNARFFGILNHDLRSPVYNLIHYLQLQKDSPELLDDQTRKNIENRNMAAAENLLQSMEDLLLWSKGQMENFRPQFNEVSIGKLFEETKNHFSTVQKIRIDFEDSEQIQLHSDENYLKTILRNLTGNAIKALSETTNPQIFWKAWTQNGQTFLSVTDNGPGIEQQQLKALYDETEVVGIQSGLGLHLIRDLAKAIDCTVTVDSKPGSGTTFTLSFA
jgi:signal transduction histidine kinase